MTGWGSPRTVPSLFAWASTVRLILPPRANKVLQAHARLEEMVADFESPVPQSVQEDLRAFFRTEYAKLQA